MTTSCLLLGSNLGDRLSYLREAFKRLQQAGIQILAVSDVYESNPWGFDSFDRFLNMAVTIETNLAAVDLLELCLLIEAELGRIRAGEGYSSRTIDIDIVLYSSQVIDLDFLQIPPPRLSVRRFALVPVVQLLPEVVHPVLKRSMIQLLNECPDQNDVIFHTSGEHVWPGSSI
ncbi:MAG TPA: 2-amino-4-hydroxy-6-hydroxymethyldihydropteridine diphosphokinase [Bacteroidales bacterium]|nr:MAG: 2-amino-4-hydroxy-6-hydroxymethyldihydropteridine diphosphokinase [Bacteroidetes bacterium GWF2_43_11]HAQ64859.1 2-amino-4-hydroxy-6-hydroxymethyldihydropteridine diphosphokinase [Bacteroidales bacterium]